MSWLAIAISNSGSSTTRKRAQSWTTFARKRQNSSSRKDRSRRPKRRNVVDTLISVNLPPSLIIQLNLFQFKEFSFKYEKFMTNAAFFNI
jgi:hypothetical protein